MPPRPSRIWALVSFVRLTPLLLRKVAICWPVASVTIFARSRLRKARLRSGSLNGIDAGAPIACGGRCLSGSTMEVSIRIARLNLFAGTSRFGFRLAEVIEPAKVRDPRADEARLA